MGDDDINQFIPSILNPRSQKRYGANYLSQMSTCSRNSLSLKKKNVSLSTSKRRPEIKSIADNVATILWPSNGANRPHKSPIKKIELDQALVSGKENEHYNTATSLLSLSGVVPLENADTNEIECLHNNNNTECVSLNASSTTEIYDINHEKDTVFIKETMPISTVSFTIKECENLRLSTKNVNIKNIDITVNKSNMNVSCEIQEKKEGSVISLCSASTHSLTVENKSNTSQNKRKSSVALQIGFKKKKELTDEGNSSVLILKSSRPENLINFTTSTSQNFNLGKCHQTSAKTPINKPLKEQHNIAETVGRHNKNESPLKQSSILSFLKDGELESSDLAKNLCLNKSEDDDCSNNVVKLDEVENGIKTNKKIRTFKSPWVHLADANHDKIMQKGDNVSQKQPSLRLPKTNNSSNKRSSFSGLHSSDVLKKVSTTSKNAIAWRSSTSADVQSNKQRSPNLSSPKKAQLVKSMPCFKIVSGTQFAVDAFAYGDIENVVAYFLTHFHSDHYMGLKKSFKKPLYCSKITADLCISKLGVNPAYITVLKMDETINIDGVDISTFEANHCPGSVMLLFTLPNGKSLLHCGDFRACPAMESYPALWNGDIHTIYLDTTYCNPRYDFPTQDESIDMAYQVLQEREMALKKKGRDFSSVLVVCGTYTIGKERFFLGLAQRMGLSIFASPEKDKMLRIVQGVSYGRHSPLNCQLHVLSMRELCHARLKEYLEGLGSVFKEVIAFKPSGWENCKHKPVKKDNITIYGIPYSEHSSFPEMIRFVKFLRPKLVIPTVDIAGGMKQVQKYFPCPISYREDVSQTKLSSFFTIQPKRVRGSGGDLNSDMNSGSSDLDL